MDKKRVLVVEDSEINLKLVRALLQMGGYEILEAVDAETGLNMAEESAPHLILMDIQLPGMDGLSATRMLKANEGTRGIPVVALSGYALDEEAGAAADAGCEDCIAKPIDTRRFLERIRQVLPSPPE